MGQLTPLPIPLLCSPESDEVMISRLQKKNGERGGLGAQGSQAGAPRGHSLDTMVTRSDPNSEGGQQ